MTDKLKPQAQTARRTKRVLEKRLPPHKLVPFDRVAQTTWSKYEQEKLREITNLLGIPAGTEPGDFDAQLLKAVDLFMSVKPTDGIETMLATQMLGVHHAAMECMRRAMLPEQSFEVRNSNLSHAQRMLDLYIRQVAALDRHRGKGQQKITVERIEVASGAQAIVGDVHAAQRQHPGVSPEPNASLEPPREEPVPVPTKRARSKVSS